LAQTITPLEILDRKRLDHAATGEGQAGLAFERRNFLGEAKGKRVLAALEEPGIEQPGNVSGADRTESDTARGGRDLDQRLQPQQPA
jgi:hypothetical protein